MPIRQSARRVAAAQLEDVARRLLRASTLCAISTVGLAGRPHINVAYFAWTPALEIVWLSAPQSRHSRNLRQNPSAAIVVFDSRQRWGNPDQGIMLFGSAVELSEVAAADCRHAYLKRFPAAAAINRSAYRCYRLHPRRVKLFDERRLGDGVFVTASMRHGRLSWLRTEIYG